MIETVIAAERGWFETITGIASGLTTLILLGLAVFVAPMAWSFWRTFRKVRELLDRVSLISPPHESVNKTFTRFGINNGIAVSGMSSKRPLI